VSWCTPIPKSVSYQRRPPHSFQSYWRRLLRNTPNEMMFSREKTFALAVRTTYEICGSHAPKGGTDHPQVFHLQTPCFPSAPHYLWKKSTAVATLDPRTDYAPFQPAHHLSVHSVLMFGTPPQRIPSMDFPSRHPCVNRNGQLFQRTKVTLTPWISTTAPTRRVIADLCFTSYCSRGRHDCHSQHFRNFGAGSRHRSLPPRACTFHHSHLASLRSRRHPCRCWWTTVVLGKKHQPTLHGHFIPSVNTDFLRLRVTVSVPLRFKGVMTLASYRRDLLYSTIDPVPLSYRK